MNERIHVCEAVLLFICIVLKLTIIFRFQSLLFVQLFQPTIIAVHLPSIRLCSLVCRHIFIRPGCCQFITRLSCKLQFICRRNSNNNSSSSIERTGKRIVTQTFHQSFFILYLQSSRGLVLVSPHEIREFLLAEV